MKPGSTTARNILLLSALEEITRAARPRGLEIVLLKGAVLLTGGVFKIHEREMTDIDVLVRPKDESAFESLLAEKGYEPMENSFSSFLRRTGKNAPPIIVDLHLSLRHVGDMDEFWKNGVIPPPACPKTGILPEAGGGVKPYMKNPGILIPSDEEMFLHLACHPFLHHGFFPEKNKKDLSAFLNFIGPGQAFWDKTRGLSRKRRLNPFVYFALAEAGVERGIRNFFLPRGREKLLSPLVKTALKRHSNFVEYAMPVLFKPGIVFRKLWPSGKTMARRNGKDSLSTRLKRLFLILKNILDKNR